MMLAAHSIAADNAPHLKFNQLLKPETLYQQRDSKALKGVVIATVGDDNACDYRLGTTRINDAINGGYIHIRVAAGTYTENISIVDKNMTIEGGYANCTDAANDVVGGGSTIIDGSGDTATSVVGISGNSDVWNITLRRLTIQNGGTISLLVGGGINVINSDANILFDNLIILENTANFGGGIGIIFGAPSINIVDTNIWSNTGNSGGGISCNSVGAGINFYDTGNAGKGSIFGNQVVLRDGGGVELLAGCSMILFSGQDPDNLIDFRGIINNTSVRHGGGVYAANGSQFTAIGFFFLAGNNDAPATVRANTADSDNNDEGNGGGIYLTGANTSAGLYNIRLSDNSAYNGGGIAVEEGATLLTEAIKFSSSCWAPGKCNQIHGNQADSFGGAIYSDQSADLETNTSIFSSHIYGNTAASAGSASYVRGEDNEFLIEGSVIYENTGGSVVLYNFTNSIARYQFNTIADNQAGLSIVRNFQGTSQLMSSIVHQLDATDVYSTVSPVDDAFDCLITHAETGFTPIFSTIIDDPEFVDRANDDYHINSFNSPAVDFCDGFTVPERDTDIDNEQRGWDDYTTVNNIGPYDIGADETYGNDIIFEDGLEM